MMNTWASIALIFVGMLFLCSCEPSRNAKCAPLKLVPAEDADFSAFLGKHKEIAPYYGSGVTQLDAKNDDLKEINHDGALDRAEDASIVFDKSYRTPFKKRYYVCVTVKTTDRILVKYSELMDPEEYRFFCSSGKFVISERRVGKAISVE